jgi:hypothetical protein
MVSHLPNSSLSQLLPTTTLPPQHLFYISHADDEQFRPPAPQLPGRIYVAHLSSEAMGSTSQQRGISNAPDSPYLESVDPNAYDDEPYCGVNAAEYLYGPDPFDEDNTNPNNYWYPSSDDDGPPAAYQPPASHSIEEGNHLHKGKNPTAYDDPVPMRARRMTLRKSTGGMMSVPRVKLTNK